MVRGRNGASIYNFEGQPGGRFIRWFSVLLEVNKLEGARIGAFYICTTLEGAPGDGH